jgi:two-component system CheB/CheR fusion protein
LISVTNFFRDRECFTALEQLIPAMFAGKGEGDSVRAWSVACATGEEAYSLAILLSEHARTLTVAPSIQVFATDLSEEAIQQARQGYYPASIEADVDQELLRRYFVKEHNAYRVRRELREMVLFAIHDVQRDSPFSRLDLVSCRNLLIYLDRTAQKRVLDILHFALVPRGKLFLGSSETVDEDGAAFEPVDKKHRIYEKQPVTRTGLPVPPAPGDMHLNAGTLPVASMPLLSGAVFDRRSSLLVGTGTAPGSGAMSWGEFHLRLLDHLSPPSVLVDSSHMMLHVSPAAARILHVRGGEPNRDLLQALDPELRVEVRAALTQAAQTYANVEIPPIQVQVGSGKVQLRTRVVPAGNLHGPVFLLQFSESELESPPPGDPIALPRDDESRSQYLDREVERLKYQLRATAEQYEAALEEQKASNEELQAMNEELRSGTEELETSREELQSINEELTTVNQALKIKVDELSRTNSDMQNLMDATPYATIFLNRELRITRYSPPAVPLFNLIRSDIGRPITDLKTELDYPELVRDAQAVLDNLAPIEREIGHAKGRYFVARLLPYRTIEDRIAGVVFSFVDITEPRRVELDLARSDAQLRMMVESATDFAIFSMDLDRRITSWNVGAEIVLGFSEREALGQSADIIFTPEDRERGVPEKEAQQALQTGRSGDERVHLRRSGERFRATGSMSLMRDGGGKAVGFVKIMRDLRQD